MNVHRPRDRFAVLLDDVYAVAGDARLWRDVLARVADYIGAEGALLTRHGEQTWMIESRLDPDLNRLYLAQYTDNPYARFLAVAPAGVPYLGSEIADARDIRRTAFHADILAPQSIVDQVAVPYQPWSGKHGAGGFGFTWSARRAKRAEQIRATFKTIVPHLMRVLDLSAAFADKAARAQDLSVVLALSPVASMLCEESHGIVFANPAAETILRDADGLSVVGGQTGPSRLAAVTTVDDRQLSRLIAQALLTSAGRGRSVGGTVRVARPSGCAPYLVCVSPLPLALSRWSGTARSLALVLVLDPQATASPGTSAALQLSFGLTPAEARTAAMIAGGCGVPAAARVSSLSPDTIRYQLARCFEKTGTRSQVDLARLVAMLPLLPVS